MSARSFAFASALVSASALAAACSVYDESLLGGTGGESGTTESTSSNNDGGADGTGGAGTGAAAPSSTSTDAISSTGIGSSGVVTTGGGCESPEDCPGDDTECSVRSCDGGVCSITASVQGVPLSRQTDGDCIQLVCDGSGGIETVNDDADLPGDDGNDCTDAVCADGAPDHVDSDPETGCAQDGGQLCDGAGVCVACLIDDDCIGDERCSEANTCVAASCDDNILNGQESAVDCGGNVCDPCPNGQTCDGASDCVSNVCNVTCQPSCTDGVLGGSETDVDCGGSCVADCTLGLMCDGDNDCDSDQCLSSVCRPRLFFSEYVEGSGNNKAVEIFNFGNVPVDLTAAACSVKIYFNGDLTPDTTILLAGSVAEFDVHVLTERAPDTVPPTPYAVEAFADQKNTNLDFNGDDAIALECMGVVLDVIGVIGVDPGTQWGANLTSTQDNTLRRGGGITEGDPNGADAFDPAVQWDGYAIDTFGGLGIHP